MTFAIIALIVMAIALVVFILIADRGFLAQGDRIVRQDKLIAELGVDGSRAKLFISAIQKKMRDEDPHHKLDVNGERIFEAFRDINELDGRLTRLRDNDTQQALAVIDDFEKKLNALTLQSNKKAAQNAEAYSKLADEVSALRQMRGAKR